MLALILSILFSNWPIQRRQRRVSVRKLSDKLLRSIALFCRKTLYLFSENHGLFVIYTTTTVKQRRVESTSSTVDTGHVDDVNSH